MIDIDNTLGIGIQESTEYRRSATGIISNKIILILRNKNLTRFSIVNFLV